MVEIDKSLLRLVEIHTVMGGHCGFPSNQACIAG